MPKKLYFSLNSSEKRIINDTFIPPEASLELGLTKLGLHLHKEANYWLEKARNDYTGYQLETIIHFRVHCALQSIKSNKKIIKETKKSVNTPNKESVNFENISKTETKECKKYYFF